MSVNDVYIKYLNILKELIRASYDKKGLRASGNFEKSLENFINKNVIGVKGASYAFQMENGRRPGAWSNVSALKEWIETKVGLPQEFKDNSERFAFLIARKHFMEGIRVPNEHNEGGVISEAVQEFRDRYLEAMFNELGEFFISRFQSDVITILRAA